MSLNERLQFTAKFGQHLTGKVSLGLACSVAGQLTGRVEVVGLLAGKYYGQLLGMLGFQPKSYQENRRTSFTLDGAQLEIDEWPMIPPYLEIEADTPDEVLRVASLLGFAEDQLTSENTTKVYARYGIDLTRHEQVRFT